VPDLVGDGTDAGELVEHVQLAQPLPDRHFQGTVLGSRPRKNARALFNAFIAELNTRPGNEFIDFRGRAQAKRAHRWCARPVRTVASGGLPW
jgi:hypothetical protein